MLHLIIETLELVRYGLVEERWAIMINEYTDNPKPGIKVAKQANIYYP